MTLSYGEVAYAETVIGYQRKGLRDHEVIDFQTLDLPQSSSQPGRSGTSLTS